MAERNLIESVRRQPLDDGPWRHGIDRLGRKIKDMTSQAEVMIVLP